VIPNVIKASRGWNRSLRGVVKISYLFPVRTRPHQSPHDVDVTILSHWGTLSKSGVRSMARVLPFRSLRLFRTVGLFGSRA
jgi:hypothetical protein